MTDHAVTTGATVRIEVALDAVGQLLHEFEYYPTLFVVSREPIENMGKEMWAVRNDRFPWSWDWRRVAIRRSKGSIKFLLGASSVVFERGAS